MKGPAAPPPGHDTILQALASAAAGGHGLTFVERREQERRVSYADVRERARRACRALRRIGVRPGDRVAIVAPTSPGFVDAFFGTLAAGGVPVPLYPPVRLGRLAEYHAATARMLEAVGARLVVADRGTSRLLGVAVNRATPELGLADAAGLVAGKEEEELPATADDLALIQFSSGSTADPKPVALTHRQVLAQLAALRALLAVDEGEQACGVSWLPLYHDMGLIGCLLSAVYFPGPLVLIAPEQFVARPALWLRAVSRHRATISVAPSFAYALTAQRVRPDELGGVDLSSWKHALCGAEPVSAETLQQFAERFAAQGFDPSALRPVYGLAEAALAVTFSPRGRGVRTLGVDGTRLARDGEAVPGSRALVSVGAPVPGFEVEIRDREGRALGERCAGRVVVRGPSVMSGYFGNGSRSRAAPEDGWLDTGDLGFVAGGELYLWGRAKDVIVIRGANHAPQEFEESLEGLEGVRPGCAVAVGFLPEGAAGEQLLILAERRPGGAAERDSDLAGRVRVRVAEATGIGPHTVLLLEPGTLPRTSSGKMRRGEALRRFLAGELGPPAGRGPVRLAAEVARSQLHLLRVKVRSGSS